MTRPIKPYGSLDEHLAKLTTRMLYEDYLDNFEINTGGAQ